jgi:predicted  nucleic acid-binding Zn-ribbon protein
MSVTKTVPGYAHTCTRCGHTWQSFSPDPLRCAGCKSPYWKQAAKARIADQIDHDQIDQKADQIDQKTANKFRVDVQAVRESTWTANAREFDTVQDADDYANDLAGRWTGMQAYRIVPVSTPKGEVVKAEDRVEV